MKNWPAWVSNSPQTEPGLIVRTTALTLAVGAAFFCACDDRPVSKGRASWSDRTTEWGLRFRHETGARGRFDLPEIMGGGVALFDADADGDADLYLTNGNRDPATGAIAPGGPRNGFFRNEGGRFVDTTDESMLGDSGYGMGVAVGDTDNDGDLDVYVANLGADRLYTNDGRGVFTEATATAGLGLGGWSSSAVFLDYDGDGWLDLFVTRYVTYFAEKRCTDAAGRDDYCGPSVFAPQADRLYRNRGDGTFEDVSESSGISRSIGRGLGVVAFDANGDRRIDLYVANDGDANHLWTQQPDGRFVDEALLLGVAYNQAGETEAGMGVLAEDLDGDGTYDLFVTHLSEESNTLYRRAGATFRDLSGASGLAAESLPYTGFGSAAIDLDLDGALDLIVANGRVSGGFETGGASPWDRFAESNQVFLNLGDGRFAELPWESGGISRGIAVADLDGDGDDDWVVANLEGSPEVWINDSEQRSHWLAVRALLAQPRRDALGATAVVVLDGQRLVRRIDRGGGYLSSREALARFGLGSRTDIGPVKIVWPDGVEEDFAIPGVDRVVELTRGEGTRP